MMVLQEPRLHLTRFLALYRTKERPSVLRRSPPQCLLYLSHLNLPQPQLRVRFRAETMGPTRYDVRHLLD